MSFKNKSYYNGVVKKQQMTFGKDDMPVLVLTVGLESEVLDTKNPESGSNPCDKIDVDVNMRFNTDNDETFGYVIKDLENLGFEGTDPEDLNPANKKHHSFVGKKVYVSPQVKVYNDRESLFWNFRFPKKYDQKPIPKGHLAKSDAAKKYAEIVKRKREEAAAGAKDITF